MDLNAIAEYLPLFGEAALLTVKLGVLGIIFSIIIGLICAVVQYYKVPVIRRIVSVYIEISRNTPLLVQLFSSITDCLKSAYRPTPKLRYRRTCLPRRKLHGGGFQERT